MKLIIERGDKSFNVEQEINSNKVSLVELQLNVGTNNVFNFRLVDDKGNNLSCIPNSISFGHTQKPQLWDYADNVDTLEFLINL